MTKEILLKIFEELQIEKSSDWLADNEIIDIYHAIVYENWMKWFAFSFDVDSIETEYDNRGQATVYINNLWNGSGYNVILDNSLEDNDWEDWNDLADRILLLEDTAKRMIEHFKM